MAEKKISQLTAKGATVADTDLLVISESAGGGAYNTKSVTGANVKALVTDANLTTTDITTNNVSTTKHGFAPKAPNDATQFLDGTGAYDTIKDSDLSTSDITTNNVSTTKHGFAPKLPNDATKFLDGTGNYSTPASGGLTKFTEAESTTSPNNTVYVDSLTAAGSSTNADFAIIPKGNGALIAKVPDGTAVGGNKRGQYAVDLTLSTDFPTRVASGNYSTNIGGHGNTASGNYSFASGAYSIASGTNSIAMMASTSSAGNSIAIGTNTASGGNTVAIGRANTASGEGSVAVSGYGCVSSGTRSVAMGESSTASSTVSTAIGYENIANGNYSVALGAYSHTFGITGRQVYASGREGTTGDAQASKFILRERTTNDTATTLTTDSGGPGFTTNQIYLSNQSAYRFKGTIIGKKSGTTDTAAWDIDGLIVRGANAASTTLIVSNVNVVDNTPTWGTPTLAADTTNGGLQVQVIGAAATNIQWTAVIETTEVIYA